MKEILIRIGCVFLGVVLTISTMKIGDLLKARPDSETVLVEEIPITEASVSDLSEDITVAENVLLYSDFEVEAEEKLKELQKENAELKAKVTALENVVNGMNTFFKGDGH